ncbi:sulfatase-like hydrolase/transferase [Paenibacillus nasutitermitis]|uniref:Arylsulfatase A family protein n=1 Tax=Paenibacillus nasutitermitis TaxID=1652958 RepID=A0A916YRN0_9BACL|nr:sulfatase-like hydrolase/transferase [Paenibacillus nasutitermitis]GGD56856.1 arylsulfatase A family protein [Paenibacillus nasutitermitis]
MASKDKNKPNIVFILTDDQGHWAMGCAGNDEIRTPNMDALADRGVRFENFFCVSPVCSPSRASLMTGKIPSCHGVQDWIKVGNMHYEGQAIEYLKDHKGYTDYLAENGYVCGISGKWNLGDSLKPQKSFSHWFVHRASGSSYNDIPMVREGDVVETKGYLTDVITEDALEFIDSQSQHDNPFYISIHYTAPHSPYIDQHPGDLVASYDDCEFKSCPQDPTHEWGQEYPITLQYSDSLASPERTRPIDVKEHLKGYYASITAVDNNLGKIVKKIESLNLSESTLIIFTGDNGFNCGHHGIWGKGNSTYPHNLYDTSVKVPAIFSQPGRIPQGVVSSALVSGYDVMPTLLDHAGVTFTPEEKMPGRSLGPIMQGTSSDDEESVFVFDELGAARMIRTKEWKYIHRYPLGPCELYDLTQDPGEKYNLLDKQNAKLDSPDQDDLVAKLKHQMELWFSKYSDPDKDGRHSGVSGRGQINLVGLQSEGKPSFNPLEKVKNILSHER